MADVTGKFKMIKSENFDNYMKAVGVGFVLRKLAATATPVTEIIRNGEDWQITTKTSFKTTDIKFKLGQVFTEETADGRQCMSTITLDGQNKMLHKQQCGEDKLEIIREFKDDEMTMILKAKDVTATRVYKKIPPK